MIVAATTLLVGFVLTIVFFAMSSPFELFSTSWDGFLPLAFLSAIATVVAFVAVVVLAVRSALRGSQSGSGAGEGNR